MAAPSLNPSGPEQWPPEDRARKAFELKMNYWSKLRDGVVHEDNLVNHRFSWLLAFEGLSMGGFFAVQNAVLKEGTTRPVILAAQIILFCLMISALWICVISGHTISAAYRQIWSIYQAWTSRYPEEAWQPCDIPSWLFRWQRSESVPDSPPPGRQFPPLRGSFNCSNWTLTQRIPFILFMMNVMAAVVCVAIFVGEIAGVKLNVAH